MRWLHCAGLDVLPVDPAIALALDGDGESHFYGKRLERLTREADCIAQKAHFRFHLPRL